MLLLISFIIQYLQPTACVYWQLGLKRHQCLSIIWIPIGICHRVSDIEELWELGGWQSCTAKAPDALHLPLDVGILDLVWVKLLRLLAEFFFQLAVGLRCLLGDAPAGISDVGVPLPLGNCNSCICSIRQCLRLLDKIAGKRQFIEVKF